MIKDLQTSVQDLTAACRASTQQIREEGEQLHEEELWASASRRAGLQQHLQQLRAQLDTLVLEHRASELALRRVSGARAPEQRVQPLCGAVRLLQGMVWFLPAPGRTHTVFVSAYLLCPHALLIPEGCCPAATAGPWLARWSPLPAC